MHVMTIDIDTNGHRKAIVIRVSSGVYAAVMDAMPRILERTRYDEIIPLNSIDIVRRRLAIDSGGTCRSEGYSYIVFEEAVCLKSEEVCTVFSYTIHVVCEGGDGCSDNGVVGLVKCLAGSFEH